MPTPDPTPLDAMLARLDRLLAASPADSTEVSWIEVRRGAAAGSEADRRAGSPRRPPRPGRPPERGRPPTPAPTAAGAPAPGEPPAAHWERTLLVRVRQSGRTGLHRTGSAEPSEIENALRDALAQARLAPPTAAAPLAAERDGAGEPAAVEDRHYDPELAALATADAAAHLAELAERGEHLRLSWLDGRVAVANSAGLRRGVRVTGAACTAACGEGAGAGRATAAARHLAALDVGALLDLARRRQAPAGGPSEPPPAAAGDLVLSEQAAAGLVDLLNHGALSAGAYGDPASLLHGRLGEAVFAPAVYLLDDATGGLALPFPFDLAGWSKRPVEMIAAGVFASPAIDSRLAHEIGRPATPHALDPEESTATNLVLSAGPAGGLDEAALLGRAEGGLWIGALDRIQCFDPHRLRFRAVARGVRRIAGAALGAAVADLVWEDSLPAVLAQVQGIGDRPLASPAGDLLFGAIAAPLLACRAGGTLTPC